jgi:hypothetical protein
MTEKTATRASEVEDILRRLEDARQPFMDALEGCESKDFAPKTKDGNSIKRLSERASDDLNFYYGRLVAQTVSLPQPPCLLQADFSSIREAIVALHVAPRRFSNLLHDLTAADLDRLATDPEHGTSSLRQILEMAAAHYRLRTDQARRILG